MTVLAVIFDYDDTLVPDSTTALLEAHGIDTEDFWKVQAPSLVSEGYDPPLAYLRLMLERIGPGRALGELTNSDLREFGSTLDRTYFPGLPELFDDLRTEVASYRDVSVEFYIVSGGLEEVIAGSEVVQRHFDGFYGCQLGEDPRTGYLGYVKRCITFTEKTRYLFEISKGIRPIDSRTQPHLVNQRVEERRVSFDHMIYVGDGLTDVPCFSLVSARGGKTFGVFQPGRESAKQAFQRLLDTGRVNSLHSPNYGEDADLGSLIRAAVATVAANIDLQSELTYRR
jgi:phosphoserine phosphatase